MKVTVSGPETKSLRLNHVHILPMPVCYTFYFSVSQLCNSLNRFTEPSTVPCLVNTTSSSIPCARCAQYLPQHDKCIESECILLACDLATWDLMRWHLSGFALFLNLHIIAINWLSWVWSKGAHKKANNLFLPTRGDVLCILSSNVLCGCSAKSLNRFRA